jgi:hypothetical protein
MSGPGAPGTGAVFASGPFSRSPPVKPCVHAVLPHTAYRRSSPSASSLPGPVPEGPGRGDEGGCQAPAMPDIRQRTRNVTRSVTRFSHSPPILVRTAQLPTPALEECDLTGEPGSYRQGKERPFTGHCYVRLACGYVARCRISPCIRRRIALAGSGDRSDPVSDSRAWAIYFDRSRTGHASPAHCEGPGAMLSASCLR